MQIVSKTAMAFSRACMGGVLAAGTRAPYSLVHDFYSFFIAEASLSITTAISLL
jgi:hypothetical protein